MSKKKLTEELLAAVRVDREEHGFTITQIRGKYDLSAGTASRAIQGMDSSKVKRAAPNRRVVTPVNGKDRPELTSTDLGEAVRKMAVGRMLLEGLRPFVPARESTAIDILILRDEGQVLKCQCKWIQPLKNGCHLFPLTCLRPGEGGKRVKHAYTRDEVDFFLGYCHDNDSFYIIPRSDTKDRTEVRIWVLRKPAGTNDVGHFDAEAYRNAFHLLSL